MMFPEGRLHRVPVWLASIPRCREDAPRNRRPLASRSPDAVRTNLRPEYAVSLALQLYTARIVSDHL